MPAEILNQEVCLLHSAAEWHFLSFCSISRLGEQPLQGSEYVLRCSHLGSSMLLAAESYDQLMDFITEQLDLMMILCSLMTTGV